MTRGGLQRPQAGYAGLRGPCRSLPDHGGTASGRPCRGRRPALRPPSPLLEPPASRGHPLRQQRNGRPAEPPSPPRDHATGCDGGEGLVGHLGEPPVARLTQPEHILDPVEDVLDDAASGRLGGLCDQVVLADLRAPLGDDPRRALPPRRTRGPRRPWPFRPRRARAGGETRAGS